MVYIGNFLYLSNLDESSETNRRYGDFSLIIRADDREKAVGQFKERIVGFKKKSELFGGMCKIFMTRLIEFGDIPETNALLLNYTSTAGDPIMPFIGCSVPSEQSDDCRIYEWKESEPEINGHQGRLFLEFQA
jgi:hypothetical protein